jgi:hypothetical protein
VKLEILFVIFPAKLKMINENILSKLPTWYKEIDKDKNYLVLTDDFDSYFSCVELIKMFGIRIGGYYGFDSGLWINKERTQGKEPIFIDLAKISGKTFDNHYTFMKNPESINPNVNVSTYYRKFNGSTFALICALYDIDLSRKSENYLTKSLCIDGWYSGYYNDGGRYKDVNIDWMDALGMNHFLLPILKSHDKQYFDDFAKQYGLKEKINISDDGYLHCEVDVKLPKCQFELVQPVTQKRVTKSEAEFIYSKDKDTIFTGAETYLNRYSISLKKVS